MALSENPVAAERLEWLRTALRTQGSVRMKDAAEALSVSEMTVRRDLLELEALGAARRVRGGAVGLGPSSLADRHPRQARAKAKIAQKLLAMVPDQGVVAFDASSTVLRLASALRGARDLMVLTNGIETFAALQGKPGVKPVLTGGEDATGSGGLVGPIAMRVTAAFHVSHVFCSSAGVDPESGSSEPDLQEAEVKREMSRVATRTVLAVDASKLGLRSATVCHEWAVIDALVTELAPTAPVLAPYRGLTELH